MRAKDDSIATEATVAMDSLFDGLKWPSMVCILYTELTGVLTVVSAVATTPVSDSFVSLLKTSAISSSLSFP